MIDAGLVLRRPSIEMWGRLWRIDVHWERGSSRPSRRRRLGSSGVCATSVGRWRSGTCSPPAPGWRRRPPVSTKRAARGFDAFQSVHGAVAMTGGRTLNVGLGLCAVLAAVDIIGLAALAMPDDAPPAVFIVVAAILLTLAGLKPAYAGRRGGVATVVWSRTLSAL